jgi:hypothetical protein
LISARGPVALDYGECCFHEKRGYSSTVTERAQAIDNYLQKHGHLGRSSTMPPSMPTASSTRRDVPDPNVGEILVNFGQGVIGIAALFIWAGLNYRPARRY